MEKNFNINNFFKNNNFKRTRRYDEHIINGYFANNLQIVFNCKIKKDNLILNEIIFLGVDLFKENLIIGFILKNDLLRMVFYLINLLQFHYQKFH